MISFKEYFVIKTLVEDKRDVVEELYDELLVLINDIETVYQDQPEDKRAFTFSDLVEALGVVEQVIIERAGELEDEDFNRWLKSVTEEVKDSVTNTFTTTEGKALRFVHQFNRIIVPLIFTYLVHLNEKTPESVTSATKLLIRSLKEKVLRKEETNDVDPELAHERIRTAGKRVKDRLGQ